MIAQLRTRRPNASRSFSGRRHTSQAIHRMSKKLRNSMVRFSVSFAWQGVHDSIGLSQTGLRAPARPYVAPSGPRFTLALAASGESGKRGGWMAVTRPAEGTNRAAAPTGRQRCAETTRLGPRTSLNLDTKHSGPTRELPEAIRAPVLRPEIPRRSRRQGSRRPHRLPPEEVWSFADRADRNAPFPARCETVQRAGADADADS